MLALGSLTTAAGQDVTPEVFGALPMVEDVDISPDGSTLVALQNFDEETAVLFYDLASGSPPTGARLAGSKARNVVWVDNQTVVLLASETGRIYRDKWEFFRWIAVDKDTGESSQVFKETQRYYTTDSGRLLATLPEESGSAVFSRVDIDGAGFAYDLYRADLEAGRNKKIASGISETDQWIVNRAGEPVVRIDFDDTARKHRVMLNGDGRYKELAAFDIASDATLNFVFTGLSPSGDSLIATRKNDNGRRSIVEINLETGELSGPLYRDSQYDVSAAIYEFMTAATIGVAFTDDLPRARYFVPALQRLQESLEALLPDAAPKLVSRSLDGSRVIVRVAYIDRPEEIFLFDRATRSLARISSTYPALDGRIHARKERYDYVASDGLTIPGYLTVPEGAAKTGMPMIVMPHGGPAARDDQAFDWWSFFYAARGYLVYQPNFRGSDGYGAPFREAGNGEWGRRMQDDVTEGVRKLISDGIADPSRVCIVGASYGGYAALAGATLTPDLYACAVSVNGVSDLLLLMMDGGDNKFAKAFWDARLGNRFRDDEALESVSPARIADRAGAAILLIHGKHDTIVPFGHSEYMARELRKADKPHELIELEGEDHWLSKSKTRTEMLARSIEFIDRHIGAEGGE